MIFGDKSQPSCDQVQEAQRKTIRELRAELETERQRAIDNGKRAQELWDAREALQEIVRREAMSEYSSIYAAPGEFAELARAALDASREEG